MDYYKQIFKRKSFHIFKDTDTLTDNEIQKLEEFIKTVKLLNYVETKCKDMLRLLCFRVRKYILSIIH